MAEELEQKEGKKSKSKAGAKKEKATKSRKKDSEQSSVFMFIVGMVIILGIIGILFGYTKDKFKELSNTGFGQDQGIEGQLEQLEDELKALSEKSKQMEEENAYNKDIVIDLFDKTREIPRAPEVTDWEVLKSDDLSFVASYPKDWEAVNPIINIKETDDGDQREEIVTLQPKKQTDYINAVTIKTDYADFISLTLDEKYEIFKELDELDSYETDSFTMIYFINIDSNDEKIPTILILSEDNIYRATFNITNKKAQNYFKYREDFEKILATFILAEDYMALEELTKALDAE
ncbi:hypothetical protein HOB30_05305 [Candidatus Falkowbacteria bacterium]|jgi:hypothetical protein|nr:hypothetical protein [Candidatus Falkowbacteria bacterium]